VVEPLDLATEFAAWSGVRTAGELQYQTSENTARPAE
jgi:hypothetical protein